MAQILSDLVESLDDTDTFYLIEKKTELLGDVYYKKTVNAEDLDYLYYGKLRDEKPNGWGILLDSSGNMGNFKKGKIEGNVIYEGEFKKGVYSGEGTLYYSDGSVQYKGKFKNGKFNGKGVLYGKDGSIMHKGEFKNGDVK